MALCLLSVLPYIGMLIAEPEYVVRQGAETVSRTVVLSALATLQIAAVMMTARFPYWALGIVASADLIILIASDQSSLGSTAVMVVIWYLVR